VKVIVCVYGKYMVDKIEDSIEESTVL